MIYHSARSAFLILVLFFSHSTLRKVKNITTSLISDDVAAVLCLTAFSYIILGREKRVRIEVSQGYEQYICCYVTDEQVYLLPIFLLHSFFIPYLFVSFFFIFSGFLWLNCEHHQRYFQFLTEISPSTHTLEIALK